MTPAPTVKPLYSQLEEAEKSLESMEKYGPDEDESTTSFWNRGKRMVSEIEWLKELIQEDTECASCDEIII